jgi:hypothetical protein
VAKGNPRRARGVTVSDSLPLFRQMCRTSRLAGEMSEQQRRTSLPCPVRLIRPRRTSRGKRWLNTISPFSQLPAKGGMLTPNLAVVVAWSHSPSGLLDAVAAVGPVCRSQGRTAPEALRARRTDEAPPGREGGRRQRPSGTGCSEKWASPGAARLVRGTLRAIQRLSRPSDERSALCSSGPGAG